MEDYQKYLDPKLLNKIDNLELKARLIVEGYISGLHKSPYHGFSVEFAQHREYVPGDDIRYVDWKVYGKSDRYYIKQYEEETNLVSYFMLDSSASMQYQGSGAMSKYQYGCHIVAALAYLILQQQDAAGLCLFDNGIKKLLAASSNPAYLKDIAHNLAAVVPEEKTDLGQVFHDAAERLRKRGLLVIVSDFFDDVPRLIAGLRHFRHRKHDIVLFHVLDPDELDLPLQRLTLFEGLEEIDLKILANPRALRNAYIEEIKKFVRELKGECLANRIDYTQISTEQNLDVALSAYLTNRSGRARI